MTSHYNIDGKIENRNHGHKTLKHNTTQNYKINVVLFIFVS